MGMIVDAKYFRGTIRQANDTSVCKRFMRVVLSAMPVVPLYVCPIFLIESKRYIFSILTIKYGIPSFVVGFLLYGYSKAIYERFNLMNEEDVSLDSSLNMGKLEDAEEERELSGKRRSQMF